MALKKREILIKVDKTEEITTLLDEIQELEKKVKSEFKQYEQLSAKEDEIFENWGFYLEEITQKLDHTTL